VLLPLLTLIAVLPLAGQESADESGQTTEEDQQEDDFFSDPFAVDEETESEDDSFFSDPFATSPDGDADSDDADTSGSVDGESDAGSSDPFATDDFDSLFQDTEMIDVADEEQMMGNPEDDLLQNEGVRWGGRIRGSVASDWNWDSAWTDEFDLFDPGSEGLSPSLSANLFFDARPDPVFRAYGKLDFGLVTDGDGGLGLVLTPDTLADGLPEGWTAEENADGETEIRDANGALVATLAADDGGAADEETVDEGTLGQTPGLEITVFELFSDFTWQDQLFFRFGKHTIRWGAGYFFSPADVLNLSTVDPEDPTAERQGPLSLRALYPFGLTGNAYLYAITNTGAELFDVALAPRVEFVAGPGELGIGAYYQRTLAPRFMTLYTASIGEVDVFAENVVLFGSDRTFVRPSRDQSAATADPDDGLDLVLETYEIPDALFLQFTAGGRYLYDFEDGPSLVLIGQYFFNGEGYSNEIDGLLPAAARLALNADENGLAGGEEDPPALGFADLTNWGRHYIGATVSLSSLFIDDFSISLFGLVNLSDFSGIASPTISYSFLERFSASLSARFTFGPSDGEYTNPQALFSGTDADPTLGLTLSVSMPGGSF
jgi:hypothetical protein